MVRNGRGRAIISRRGRRCEGLGSAWATTRRTTSTTYAALEASARSSFTFTFTRHATSCGTRCSIRASRSPDVERLASETSPLASSAPTDALPVADYRATESARSRGAAAKLRS
jgi:hypothetical protein